MSDQIERELDFLIAARVAEALADPRPPIPLEEAFAQVREALAVPSARKNEFP